MFLLRRKTFKVQKSSTGGNAESSGSDIFSEMDFHGLSDVLKADSWSIRSFWVATIVGSTIFAAYMSYWLLGNAVDHPTVTKIEYLSPNTVRYPVITICDRSGSFLLNQTKLAEDHIDVNIVNLMLLSGPIWTNESPDRTLVADEKRKNFLKSWEAKFNSSAEALLQFFLRYGLNCDGIFHSCRDPNWDRKNCCEMFSPVIHIRRGLCFALLPQYAPSITAPGLFSNFFLKFKNPPNLWNGNSKPGLLALEIMIDTGVDQGVWRSDAVAIDMGYWGTLKLSMTRVTTETTKATPCERHPELSYFQDYTFSNCMWERRLLKLLKAKQILNCTLPITLLTKLGYLNRDNISTKRSPTVQQCDLNILFSTIYEHLNSTNSNTQSDAELTGISYWLNRLQMSGENPCRLPCDHWEYNYAVERDLEYPNRDFAGLTITIVDSQYPHCREVPALEWLDYLALIGGTWGLWSGASAITVVQMIVYSGRCLLHLSSRK